MIRRLNSEDKDEILKITKDIWEGEDYIPLLIDEWISDTKSIIAGYFEQNRLLGFGRLSFLTDTDVWFEGLRKDPEIEFKGLTYKLADFFFEVISKMDVLSSVRFITYFDNYASIKANEKLGFELTHTFSYKEKPFQRKEVILPENIKFHSKLGKFHTRIKNSEYLSRSGGLIVKGWKALEFDKGLENKILESGYLISYEKDSDIKGIALLWDIGFEPCLWLSYIDYDSKETLGVLINAIEYKGYKGNLKELQTAVPDCETLREDLNEMGFVSWQQEDDFLFYELPIEHLKRRKNE